MIDLGGHRYADNKACIVCRHVLEGAPVLAFAHDADGDLHFTCGGEDHRDEDWLVVGLDHIDLTAHGLDTAPLLNAGTEAVRSSIYALWEAIELRER